MEGDGFCLLPDRQGLAGPDRKVLMDKMNGGIMAKVQERTRELQAEGKVWTHPSHPIDWGAEVRNRPDRGSLVVLYEDDEVKVVANSNGSYGYLYLAAWLKPEARDV